MTGHLKSAFMRGLDGCLQFGRAQRHIRLERSRALTCCVYDLLCDLLWVRLGANSVRFQGRLDARLRLGLGRYRVVVTVTDAAGNASKPATGPTFRIVRR